jgi:hypothetical protein
MERRKPVEHLKTLAGSAALAAAGAFGVFELLRTGEFHGRGMHIERLDQPVAFWLIVALFAVCALVFTAAFLFFLISPFNRRHENAKVDRLIRNRIENPTPRVEPLRRDDGDTR